MALINEICDELPLLALIVAGMTVNSRMEYWLVHTKDRDIEINCRHDAEIAREQGYVRLLLGLGYRSKLVAYFDKKENTLYATTDYAQFAPELDKSKVLYIQNKLYSCLTKHIDNIKMVQIPAEPQQFVTNLPLGVFYEE